MVCLQKFIIADSSGSSLSVTLKTEKELSLVLGVGWSMQMGNGVTLKFSQLCSLYSSFSLTLLVDYLLVMSVKVIILCMFLFTGHTYLHLALSSAVL